MLRIDQGLAALLIRGLERVGALLVLALAMGMLTYYLLQIAPKVERIAIAAERAAAALETIAQRDRGPTPFLPPR